jgi:hypothetical protein
MLPVKNYQLTGTEQTIEFIGEGDYYHVKNNGSGSMLIAYLPENESHELTENADGVLTLDAGEVFHYAVVPTWELVAKGNGVLTVMTTTENTNPFDSAASADSADGGDWDVTHTYRKSQPHLWAAMSEIDWGDGTYSAYLTYEDNQPSSIGRVYWDYTYYAPASDIDIIVDFGGYAVFTNKTTGVKTNRNMNGYLVAQDVSTGGTTYYGVGAEYVNGNRAIYFSYYQSVYENKRINFNLFVTYTKIA